MTDANKHQTPHHNFSDYVVYVGESWDHRLGSIGSQYPIFCLAFCIFKHTEYIQAVAPALNMLKYKYWGHCDVSKFIERASFEVIACIIDKQASQNRYRSRTEPPYDTALLFCMERLNTWLMHKRQQGKKVSIHFESRGKVEDELRGKTGYGLNLKSRFPSKTDFSMIGYAVRWLDKKANSTGLQVADLVAKSIDAHDLRHDQTDQNSLAFEAIEPKLARHSDGSFTQFGLKIFPMDDSTVKYVARFYENSDVSRPLTPQETDEMLAKFAAYIRH